MRQLRQLGSPFKYLGSPSSQHRDALNLAQDAAEGIWAVADFVPGGRFAGPPGALAPGLSQSRNLMIVRAFRT
jgi:hypothetical protein